MREPRDSQLVRTAVALAQEGSAEALHFLYVRYASDALRCVSGLVDDRREAEDITQNVFAELTAAIHEYEPRDAPFSAWILRVARDTALGHPSARQVTST